MGESEQSMSDLTAQRTLVKSPPELWSELSELESLARHLGEFGEIRITKLEPEHSVAWEGEHASGTVAIEAAGWGTKVTMTVAIPDATAAVEAEREPAPVEAAAPELEPEPTTAELAAIELTATRPVEPPAPEPPATPPAPAPAGKVGFFGRLFGRRRGVTAPEPVVPEPTSPEPAAPEPRAPVPQAPERAPDHAPMGEHKALEVLDSALDDLGAAHHRPFSRG